MKFIIVFLPILVKGFIQPYNVKFNSFTKSNSIYENNNIEDFNPINTQIELKCFGNTDFSKKNLKNKKLITISPGGTQGFYMLGVVKFLCNEYNINKNSTFIYSGASAGSWISLILCLKGNTNKMIDDLISLNFSSANSILEWEYIIRDYILNYYRITDFDFHKIFISVTRISVFNDIKVFKLNNDIYSDFTSLLDALECCIASSHIPFITGGLFNIYKNKLGYDGGFLDDPYIKNVTKILQIKHNMYSNSDLEYSRSNSLDINGLLNKDDVDIIKLFNKGFEDSQMNKPFLDTIFL